MTVSFQYAFQKHEPKRNSIAPVLPTDKSQQQQRDLATPGFRLRQKNPLVKIELGSHESLTTDEPSDLDIPKDDDITETRMKQILGHVQRQGNTSSNL